MKKFEIPEVKVIYFEQKDVIATSTPCTCVECTICPDGSNHCPKVDDL